MAKLGVQTTVILGEALIEARPGFASGEDLPDGILQFRMNNVTRDGAIDWSSTRRVPLPANGTDLLLERGDILFNTTNSPELVGKSAYFDGHREHVTFSNHFLRLKVNSRYIDAKYLSHWLRWQFARGTFLLMSRRWVNQAAINQDQLMKMQVPAPPIDEQRRIAAILDRAEALGAKRRQALAKLDTLAQSLFLEMFGDPAENPKNWQRAKLADVCELVTDGEHLTPLRSEAGMKLLSARNIRDGYLDFSDVDYVGEAEFKRITSRCKPQRGDVLISCSGTIGRVSAIRTDEPLSLVRSAALVRPKQEISRTDYLEAWLRLSYLAALMRRRANASSQANLFQNQIRELPVLLPGVELQDGFIARSRAVYSLREKYVLMEQNTQSLSASLQHRAFRGEL